MSSVSATVASGMRAAERRLEASAHNVASGLPGDAPDEVVQAFTALRADQVQTPGGGTAARVSAQFGGNVDLVHEAVQQIVARYAFAANAQVMRADARMQKCLLDTKV